MNESLKCAERSALTPALSHKRRAWWCEWRYGRLREREKMRALAAVAGGEEADVGGVFRVFVDFALVGGDVVGVPAVEGGDVGEGAVPDGALDEDERDGPDEQGGQGHGDRCLRATTVWPTSQPRRRPMMWAVLPMLPPK